MAKDGEFAGVLMKRGDRTLLHTGTANHDSAEYSNAMSVDLDRTAAGHLTFGMGIHRCIGAPLAMLEVQIALEVLHATIPDYVTDPSDPVVYLVSQSKVTPLRVPFSLRRPSRVVNAVGRRPTVAVERRIGTR